MLRQLAIAASTGAVLCMWAGVALADDPDVDCNNAMTQFEMNVCAGRDFQRADEELDADLAKILPRLDALEQDLFKQAQLAWTKFRDAECEFQSSFTRGGTVQPMVHAYCLAGMTKNRVKEMEYYLTCEEGDLSCPPGGR